MTPVGRELLTRYAGNFEVGSVGAWVDILRHEKRYDALVIFSDFNDQVLQTRAGAGEVYVDDAAQRALPDAEIADTRTVAEKVWEDSWMGSFELAGAGKGPALYLFLHASCGDTRAAEVRRSLGRKIHARRLAPT
jgi:hypothetical protein